MELPNFNTETCTYLSCKECATARNIDIEVLLAARATKPLPPGMHESGRIKWHEFQPWFVEHYRELAATTGDEREKLELRKLKAEVVKLENFNKTRSKDFISRKLVLKTVLTLYGQLFSQLTRYLEQEQPSRCEGMTALQLKTANKDYLSTLFSSLKNQSELWKDCQDLGEEADEESKPTETSTPDETTNDTARDTPSV